MTVKQLIEKLKEYDGNKKIVISSDAECNDVYTDIYIEDYDGKRLVIFGAGETI